MITENRLLSVARKAKQIAGKMRPNDVRFAAEHGVPGIKKTSARRPRHVFTKIG